MSVVSAQLSPAASTTLTAVGFEGVPTHCSDQLLKLLPIVYHIPLEASREDNCLKCLAFFDQAFDVLTDR